MEDSSPLVPTCIFNIFLATDRRLIIIEISSWIVDVAATFPTRVTVSPRLLSVIKFTVIFLPADGAALGQISVRMFAVPSRVDSVRVFFSFFFLFLYDCWRTNADETRFIREREDLLCLNFTIYSYFRDLWLLSIIYCDFIMKETGYLFPRKI